MSSVIKTDICVIGGGSGGLSVSAGAAQMGANVVLIEGDKMGIDCLNYGCVPSKSLIASAKHAYDVADAGRFGGKGVRGHKGNRSLQLLGLLLTFVPTVVP